MTPRLASALTAAITAPSLASLPARSSATFCPFFLGIQWRHPYPLLRQ